MKVVNYAQWRSLKDLEAMRQTRGPTAHIEAAATVATFDPILCAFVDSISVSGKLPQGT